MTADIAVRGSVEIGTTPLAQVDLRVRAADAPALALPVEPNTWTAGGDRELVWLGPDEWLLLGRPGTETVIVADLERSLDGTHHSVVDVSAARVVLELRGDGRHDVLAQGCGLDLHPRSWAGGRCAQTLLAHVPVLLQERDDRTRVLVRPSFAGWLRDWLHVARADG